MSENVVDLLADEDLANYRITVVVYFKSGRVETIADAISVEKRGDTLRVVTNYSAPGLLEAHGNYTFHGPDLAGYGIYAAKR